MRHFWRLFLTRNFRRGKNPSPSIMSSLWVHIDLPSTYLIEESSIIETKRTRRKFTENGYIVLKLNLIRWYLYGSMAARAHRNCQEI